MPHGDDMEFRSYTQELEDLVKAFNVRLRRGGETHYALPESNVMRHPKLPNRACYQESFLLLERGEVRGGYILQHQKYYVRGETITIGVGPQLPLSEGIVNPSYIQVGVLLLRHALQTEPLLCEFGIGGLKERYARLLQAGGWALTTVPFRFRVTNPEAFLANVTYLQQRWTFIWKFLHRSTAACLLLRVAQLRLLQQRHGVNAEIVGAFDSWADSVWEECKSKYSFLAVRDSATLNILYPPANPRFLRLRVSCGPRTLGWAVVLATQMCSHKYFGNMRVGSIVDCLALPEHAATVTWVATDYLQHKEVDIIVSNQSSTAWRAALFANGFLPGPSNFLFGMSRPLAAKLQPLNECFRTAHVNRGDGDGPINL